MPDLVSQFSKAKEAGYSDDDILQFLGQRLKSHGPGVAKPGLPSPDADSHGRVMPHFGGDSYGSEMPMLPGNFVASGLNQMEEGAAQMTRKPDAHPHSQNESPKLGGASKIFRGASQIAAPVAAGLLPGALIAAPGLVAGGIIGGYAGGKLAKAGAEALEANPDTQDFLEDAGTVAGGAIGAKLGDSVGSVATRVRNYLTEPGIADATKDAAIDAVPFWGKKVNSYRKKVLTIKAKNAADALANAGSPPIPVASPGPLRQAIAKARAAEFAPPDAMPDAPSPVVANGRVPPTPSERISRAESVPPPSKPREPGTVRKAHAEMRELMDAAIDPPPPPAVLGIPQTETPYGRKPGGPHNVPPPPPPRKPPAWKNFDVAPLAADEPLIIPKQAETPTGRKVPSVEDRMRRANEPVAPKPPPMKGGPSPAEVIANQEQSLKNVKAFIDAKEGLKPIAVPPEPKPPVTTGPRDTGMAANMRARDASAESVTPGGTDETVYQSGKHDSLLDHDQNAINKRNNIREYIEANGGLTPEQLDKMGDEDFRSIADAALEWGRAKGNPVPKGKYRTASTSSDTWGKIKRDLHPNVYDPAGLKDHLK